MGAPLAQWVKHWPGGSFASNPAGGEILSYHKRVSLRTVFHHRLSIGSNYCEKKKKEKKKLFVNSLDYTHAHAR